MKKTLFRSFLRRILFFRQITAGCGGENEGGDGAAAAVGAVFERNFCAHGVGGRFGEKEAQTCAGRFTDSLEGREKVDAFVDAGAFIDHFQFDFVFIERAGAEDDFFAPGGELDGVLQEILEDLVEQGRLDTANQ